MPGGHSPLERAHSHVMTTTLPHIPEEQLAFGDQISSEGSSGIVYKGVWDKGDGSDKVEVAIKVVKCDGERHSLQFNSTKRLFEQEIAVFQRGSECGDRICQLQGVSELSDGHTLCCVMKLYGPSLADIIRGNGQKPLSLPEIRAYALDCLEALTALHDEGLIMQDFKPANVLTDENNNAIVADFDMASDVGHRDGIALITSSTGTPAYQSPEAWEPNNFGGVTVKTDMWGFACFMVELATGVEPWPGMRWPSIRRAILNDCKVPEVPDAYPEAIRTILKQCLTIIPEHRPHAREVLEVFQETDWGLADGENKAGLDKLSKLNLDGKEK